MKRLILGFLVLVVSGCGTIKTVPRSDYAINSDLNRNKTKCKTVPRVYSGVKYDFCRFHAEPDYQTIVNLGGTPFYLFDMLLFSPAADTVMLPVTIYQQVTRGTLKLEKP